MFQKSISRSFAALIMATALMACDKPTAEATPTTAATAAAATTPGLEPGQYTKTLKDGTIVTYNADGSVVEVPDDTAPAETYANLPADQLASKDLPADNAIAKTYKADPLGTAASYNELFPLGLAGHGYVQFEADCGIDAAENDFDQVSYHCEYNRFGFLSNEEMAKVLPPLPNAEILNHKDWICTTTFCMDETGKPVGAVQVTMSNWLTRHCQQDPATFIWACNL